MTTNGIKISPEFKAQTIKAIFAIVLFVLSYLIIFLLTIGLTVLCVYGAIMLILIKPMLATIALGIGLASVGFLVLFFLVKFIFKSHKTDRSHMTEVRQSEEPQLFKLIEEIVGEVGTSFPKKVYLSTDVNASVFYDSNFWSMFLPIRKNLQIGLGLVNSVTINELKAILAHEFGHFSQKTMKVGSYVYNANQVIFNMLYDNDSYNKLLQNWANVSNYFYISVVLASKIIEGIQWILRKLYDFVNKRYMSLSREMEFHADEIAAHVTGFEPLKHSLLRLSLADQAFSSVLNFYGDKITDNIKSKNLFKEQLFVMNFLAKRYKIPIINNLPEVTVETFSKFDKSKLVIEDQWASHPSTKDRIERLEKTNIKTIDMLNSPANYLFSNIEDIQLSFTDQLFKKVEYKGKTNFLSFDDFKVKYSHNALINSFPDIYNSYYDNKNPIPFELETLSDVEHNLRFEDLFSDQKVDLVYTAIDLKKDMETLRQIADQTLPVKTFDYEGVKYKRKESIELLERLKRESEQVEEQIKQNDLQVFQFFRQLETPTPHGSLLEHYYKAFFEFDKKFDANYNDYLQLVDKLQFVNVTTPFEQIKLNFYQLEPLEAKLKAEIKKILENEVYKEAITPEIKDNFELYLSKEWMYFEGTRYLGS